MRYIFPYVFALVYWLLFFVANAIPSIAYYVLACLGVWFIVTIAVVDGKRWYQHWRTWLHVALLLISSFFFSLIIASPGFRQLYIMIAGVVGGALVYVLLRSMQSVNPFIARSYLLVMSFLHIVTFWLCAAILYFISVSYDANSVTVVVLFAILAYVLGHGSIFDYGLKKSSARLVLSVLVLTTAELSAFLMLLPIHYYALATVLTVWFFFIVQMVVAGQELSSRKPIFKKYLLFFLVATALILLTTPWQ